LEGIFLVARANYLIEMIAFEVALALADFDPHLV
jgi:hypothetical protein